MEENNISNNNFNRKKMVKISILGLVALILAIGGGLPMPTLP